jgi:hypothetical protein
LTAQTTDFSVESVAPVVAGNERQAGLRVERFRMSPDSKPGESVSLSKELLWIVAGL